MNTLKRLYGERGGIRGFRFDPRTKIALLVLLDTAVFLGRSLPYEIGVFLVCALLVGMSGMLGTSLRCCVAFALLVAVQWVVEPSMASSRALWCSS